MVSNCHFMFALPQLYTHGETVRVYQQSSVYRLMMASCKMLTCCPTRMCLCVGSLEVTLVKTSLGVRPGHRPLTEDISCRINGTTHTHTHTHTPRDCYCRDDLSLSSVQWFSFHHSFLPSLSQSLTLHLYPLCVSILALCPLPLSHTFTERERGCV